MSRSTWMLFVALSIVWGLPYFFIKVALVEFEPSSIAFGRVILGAVALIGFVPRSDWLALRGSLAAITAIAFTDIALPFYLIATGERTVSSSLTGIILSSMPIAVSFLALAIDRRKRLTRTQLAGLVIGVAGVVSILGFSGGHGRPEFRGVLMVAGATLSYSVSVLMIERWLPKLPMLATAAAMLIAAAVMLAPTILLSALPSVPGVAALTAIGALGLVCTAAAYVMYFALIARAGPMRASVVTYLNPAVAAVLGIAVLHESMGVATIAGLFLVVAGSWLSISGPSPQRQVSAPRPHSD